MLICSDEFFAHLHSISEVEIPSQKIIQKAYDERLNFHPSGKLLWLEKGVPWKEFLKDKSEVLFVLF